MSSNLKEQHEAFKKTMLRRPIIPRPIPSTAPPKPPSPSLSITSVRHVNSLVHAVISYLKVVPNLYIRMHPDLLCIE